MAYNRSKNSELEEWLRQAAEVRNHGNKESGGGGLYIIFTSSPHSSYLCAHKFISKDFYIVTKIFQLWTFYSSKFPGKK